MVLPVGDVNPTSRRAWVTGLFLAINAAVFLLVQLPLQGCDEVAFIYQWAAVPTELLRLEQVPPGAVADLAGGCQVAVDKSIAASAVTSMFLHGNLGHLLVNLLFLWIFGANVEDRLGHARFVGFYLGGGLVATYAFALLNPSSLVPLLGASGAIAAVLGAYLILYPKARVLTYVPFPLYLLALIIPGIRIRNFWLIFAIVTMPAWVLLTGWFVVQLSAAQAPAAATGVAYEAHAAGFVAGILLVLLLDRRRQRRGQPTFHPVRDDRRRRPRG
jgi:membrane associated rhomboid family serine protease